MKLFKRACLNIIRMPIRSLIMFLLIFALGSVTAFTILIQQAMGITEENLRRSMLPVVMIDQDREFLRYNFEFYYERITLSVLEKFSESEQVDFFDIRLEQSMVSHELSPWSPFDRADDRTVGFIGSPWILNSQADLGYRENFRIQGVSTPYFLDLKFDNITITSGANFSSRQLEDGESVAIVSNNWARHNNLELGDTFILRNEYWGLVPVFDVFSYEDHEFKIIGLFDVEGNHPELWENYYEPVWGEEARVFLNENRIYVPNRKIERLHDFQNEQRLFFEDFDNIRDDDPGLLPIFVLRNHTYLENFENQIREYIPIQYRTFNLNNRFESFSAAVEILSNFSTGLFIGASVFSIIVIGLVMIIFIHDRRNEIGILFALGERKGNVLLQIFLELMLISVISLTASLLLTNVFSQQISRNLLLNNLIEIQAEITLPENMIYGNMIDNLEWLGFGARMEVEEMIDFFDVSVNGTTIILFYVLALSLISVTMFIPMYVLTKITPRKVLL